MLIFCLKPETSCFFKKLWFLLVQTIPDNENLDNEIRDLSELCSSLCAQLPPTSAWCGVAAKQKQNKKPKLLCLTNSTVEEQLFYLQFIYNLPTYLPTYACVVLAQ